MSIIFSDGAEMFSTIYSAIFSRMLSGAPFGALFGTLSVMVLAHALWHQAAYRGARSWGARSRGRDPGGEIQGEKPCRAED